MKKLLLAIPLCLPLFGVQAKPFNGNVTCVESIYNGVTKAGEVVNLCLQKNGNFYYGRLKKGTDTPIVSLDISPKDTGFIDEKSDKLTFKEFLFREGDKVFRLVYQVNKKGERAEVSEDADAQLVITPESLTTNITNKLSKHGVGPIDVEYDRTLD